MASKQAPRLLNKLLTLTQGTLGTMIVVGVFVASLLIAAVAHLNLRVSRRAAAQVLTSLISESLRGTVRIGAFTQLSRGELGVESVEVLDPDGRPTLRIKRLSAEVDVLGLVERILSESEKLSIEVSRLKLRGCEVFLLTTTDKDASGAPLSHPSIADAFEPVKTTAKKKRSTKERPVRVWFPHVHLRDVYARGSIAGSPTIESRVQSAGAQILITDKGATIDVKRFKLLASGVGGVDLTASGEVHVRAPGPVWGDVSGTVGEVPLHQRFRFENEKLDVEGELPDLRPESLRPLFGTWPLDRPISVTNHISGVPPLLNVDLSIQPERGAPTVVTGSLQIAPRFEAKLGVVTNELNLQDLISTLPPSKIDSESAVVLRQAEGGILVGLETKVQEGTVDGHKTPAADLVGTWGNDKLNVEGELREDGLDARIQVSKSGGSPLQLELRLKRLDLSKNERTRAILPATSGILDGTIKGTLDDDALSAHAELNLKGVRSDGLSFSRGVLHTNIGGKISEPLQLSGKTKLNLNDVTVGEVKLSQAELQAEGPIVTPHLKLQATTEAGVQLKIAAQAGLIDEDFTDISASITGKGTPIDATAGRVSFAHSRVAVTDLMLKSIGEISGDVDFGATGGTIKLQATGLSISRLASSLGLPKKEYGGDLNAHINLKVSERSYGTVDLVIHNGALHGIDNVELDAHATIEGNRTTGNLNGSIQGLAEVQSSWEGELAGPLLDPASSAQATGKMRGKLRSFDLKSFTILLGKALGMPEMTGTIDAVASVERVSPSSFPELEATVTTQNLAVHMGSGKDAVTFRGIDLDGGFSTDPDADLIEAVVRLNDRDGTLASLSGTLALPLSRWAVKLPDESEFTPTVRGGALNAVVVIPRRKLRRFPSFIELPIEEGSLAARASITGTLDAPEFGVAVNARRLDGPSSPFTSPVDVDVNARYLAASGSLRGSFSLEQDGQRVGTVQTDLLIPLENLVDPPRGPVPLWTGSAQVQLDNSPLQMLKEFKERQMAGSAQGSISLRRDGWDTEISSEIRLRSMAFGGHRLGDALLEANTHGPDLVARALFTDEYGSLQVTAEAGVETTRPFLRIAEARPIYVSLESDRYDAAVTLPFVADVFDELNGSMSGKLRAEWTPPSTPDGDWSTTLTGHLKMSEGLMTPSALGLRLEETRFSMTAVREGEFNVIRLKDIAARAESKRHNLKGDAALYFKNLDLHGGTFHLSPDEVPFKSNGVTLATLTGTAQGRFDMSGAETRVEVGINNLVATLPATSESDLFELEENSSIEVLQYASKEQAEEEAPDEESIIDVKFRLGNNVQLKSQVIDLKVRGTPQMRLAEDVQISGAVELVPGGRVDVMGRGFRVEQGTVMFDTGDATNPQLSASATWKAPNDVLVRATLGGTAQKPTLRWSSEPALPGGEAEIIALILGGGSGGEQQATSATFSSLALAANEAIGQSGIKGVEFYTTQEAGSGDGRVASLNDSSWDSYTAAFRISDEIWVEGSFQRGGAAGPAGAKNKQNGVGGTLDWRFHPHWSARTEIGMLGTGLDLIWRYRY